MIIQIKKQSTLATMSNVVVNTGSGQVDLASKRNKYRYIKSTRSNKR